MRWALGIVLAFNVVVSACADDATDALRQVKMEGPVTLTVEVSANQTSVAKPLSIRLEVEAPQSYSVSLPFSDADPSELPALGSFKILAMNSVNGIPIDGSDSRRQWFSDLSVETYQVGELEIPSLEVIVRISDEGSKEAFAEQVIRSEPFPIQVVSVLRENESPADFRDIKDLEEIPAEEGSTHRYWPVISVCLAIVAVYLFRRPTISPFQLANSEVDQIELAWNDKSIDTSQAYAKLATTLRRYFDSRLDISASSMSANELAAKLTEMEVPSSTINSVTHFFGEADQLKFSGSLVLDFSHDRSPFDSVREIIRETDGTMTGGKS